MISCSTHTSAASFHLVLVLMAVIIGALSDLATAYDSRSYLVDVGERFLTLTLAFDNAGSIKSQKVPAPAPGSGTVTISYVHDAWNRLVEVKYDGTVRSAFMYNALHQRVVKTADVRGSTPNADDPPDGTIDQQRRMFYDAAWRLVEERIDDTYSGGGFSEDRRMQYFWGIRGSDDIVLHRWKTSSGLAYDNNFHHLTDTQFSTIVIIDETALEIERISYDAYGRPRHHPLGDLTGDGTVGEDDRSLMESYITASPPITGTVADLDRNGVVYRPDGGLQYANLGVFLAEGVLSFAAVDNQLGYAGYVYHGWTGRLRTSSRRPHFRRRRASGHQTDHAEHRWFRGVAVHERQ